VSYPEIALEPVVQGGN